jgi:gluconate kinase
MVKVIILGPQCSGKTTIANVLKTYSLDFPIIDEDEEINRRNGGKSPSNWTDWDYKWQVLRPQIQSDIINMNNIVFFTSYFDMNLLRRAKEKGFKIIQLHTEKSNLEQRNKERMKKGIDDASYGWSLNMPYHEMLQQEGFIDTSISTDRPLQEVCRSILTSIRFSFGYFTKKSLSRKTSATR